MMELFDKDKDLKKKKKNLNSILLAQRLRPTKIKDFLGNSDIIKNVIKNITVSLIFWGPPGVGKTTLAKIIANHIKINFISRSAYTYVCPESRKFYIALS